MSSLDASDLEQDNILWSSLAAAMSFLHSERSGEVFEYWSTLVSVRKHAACVSILSPYYYLSLSVIFLCSFMFSFLSLSRQVSRVSISTCAHHVHISGERGIHDCCM